MDIGNILIICMLIYYSIYFINLFINGIGGLQQVNTELDNLRKKPIKTLEEQKEFLNLKYPKKQKTKKTFKWWIQIIGMIILTIIIGFIYNYFFKLFNIKINFWWALLFVTLFPLLLNIFLSKFKLDKNDLLDLFKR